MKTQRIILKHIVVLHFDFTKKKIKDKLPTFEGLLQAVNIVAAQKRTNKKIMWERIVGVKKPVFDQQPTTKNLVIWLPNGIAKVTCTFSFKIGNTEKVQFNFEFWWLSKCLQVQKYSSIVAVLCHFEALWHQSLCW